MTSKGKSKISRVITHKEALSALARIERPPEHQRPSLTADLERRVDAARAKFLTSLCGD